MSLLGFSKKQVSVHEISLPRQRALKNCKVQALNHSYRSDQKSQTFAEIGARTWRTQRSLSLQLLMVENPG